ncbi:MAG: cytochrome c [Betaproteobacteria bacterium]
MYSSLDARAISRPSRRADHGPVAISLGAGRARPPRQWRSKLAFAALILLATNAHADDAASGGFYSEAQALRGGQLYEQHCTVCHGGKLEGNPGAPLAGPAFLGRWADGQHTIDDLFYVIRTSMPYSAPGSLSKQQYADVVAFILKSNGYPVGELELPPESRALKKAIPQSH